MENPDVRLLLLAAFAREKYVDYRYWPEIATYLLTVAYDGDKLAELAGLDLGPFDAWDTDRLVPAVLSELGVPLVNDSAALSLVAGSVARMNAVGRLSNTSAARILAAMYVMSGYPKEPAALGEAYFAEEFLDCDCHDPGNDLRKALAELNKFVPADADGDLIARLLGLSSRA